MFKPLFNGESTRTATPPPPSLRDKRRRKRATHDLCLVGISLHLIVVAACDGGDVPGPYASPSETDDDTPLERITPTHDDADAAGGPLTADANVDGGAWTADLDAGTGGSEDGSSVHDSGALFVGEADAGSEDLIVDAGGSAPDDGGNTSAHDAGMTTPEIGTFDHPIVVDTFPWSFSGDTEAAPSDAADVYPCAPNTPEAGGEYVFRLEIPNAGTDQQLVLAVDDVSGDNIDIDLHLLTDANPDACIERDNKIIEMVVSPGETLFFTADTWTASGGVDLAGPFTVSASLTDVDVTNCFENPIPSCTESTYPLVNGVPVEPAGEGGCPDGMLRINAFCVDRYEGALVEVLADGTLAPFSPFQNPGNVSVRAVSAPGLVPQGYISGHQAESACQAAGKRLCSDTEWSRACQGANQTTYPYGQSKIPGVCNDARTCHPAVQYYESNAQWVWSSLDHACINQLPGAVDATGANAGCISDDGAFDMMGNLHEWTSNSGGVFRGGFYVDTFHNGEGCTYATTLHAKSYSDYSTGFRCCADAP